MKGFKHLIQACLAVIAMGVASQAMAIMSAPDGWYVEGNFGSSGQSGKSYPGNASPSGVGGSGNLGYKFMPYLGVEGNYTLYSQTSINNNAGTLAAKDRLYSIGLAARGIFPVVDTGLEVFGRLGAAQVRSKVTVKNAAAAAALGIGNKSSSQIGVYWGLGASYYFMPELAINAQYAKAMGSSSTGDMDLLSAGITFIFG